MLDASLGEDQWRDVVHELSRPLGTELIVLYERARHGTTPLVDNILRETTVATWNEYWAPKEPAGTRVFLEQSGKLITPEASGWWEESDRSEFTNDFARKQFGVGRSMYIWWPGTTNDSAFGMAFHRPDRAGPFSPHEVDEVQRYMPHLHRALRLYAQRRNRHEGLKAFNLPVIEVSSKLRVLWMNRACSSFVERQSDLLVRVGRLACSFREDTSLLQRATCAAIASPEGTGVVWIPRRTGRPLHIEICRSNDGALLFIRCLDNDRLASASSLQRGLGLTARETEVALQLARGMKVQDLATHLSLTEGTVRNYLKKAMQKLGVDRQHELVRLISRLELLDHG